MKTSAYPTWVLGLALFLVLLQQSSWLWSDARLVLGMPINLFYHSLLSLLLSAIMLVIVRFAWPGYLDKD